jgi:hypothetical protein
MQNRVMIDAEADEERGEPSDERSETVRGPMQNPNILDSRTQSDLIRELNQT